MCQEWVTCREQERERAADSQFVTHFGDVFRSNYSLMTKCWRCKSTHTHTRTVKYRNGRRWKWEHAQFRQIDYAFLMDQQAKQQTITIAITTIIRKRTRQKTLWACNSWVCVWVCVWEHACVCVWSVCALKCGRFQLKSANDRRRHEKWSKNRTQKMATVLKRDSERNRAR